MRTFEVKGGAFYADGKEYKVYSGAIHYFRVPHEYWRDRLMKLKACGFNTVETYVCWNMHEPREGEFDFSGDLDVAGFVRTAGELGLNVIVRPGPYICAEWDLGGLPAWLLADKNMRLRVNHPAYLEKVGRFMTRLMSELVPLQCTRGGPVIAMQVENEYGSYGNDKGYLAALKEMLISLGVEVLLFTSDGTCGYMLAGGTTPGALVTANFGSNPAGNFSALKSFSPDGPEMCMEFWCGWFDRFRGRHHTRPASSVAKTMASFLERGASFNMYMFHGGTNFGFGAGANFYARYTPTVTSYDYCAPLGEYGGYTPAYHAIMRLLCEKQGVKPLDLPPEPKLQNIGEVALTECAGLLANARRIGSVHRSPLPESMEYYGQNFGLILYSTVLPGDYGTGFLKLKGVHDRAYLYVDGALKKVFDRTRTRGCDFSVVLAGLKKGSRIDILVDALGRVNYGEHLYDRKGIESVMFNNQTLMDFEVTAIPLDDFSGLDWSAGREEKHRFYRGSFSADPEADCFVDMRGFGKGYVWVNGFNLGRYWSVGPQKTLYLPGVRLRADAPNEIVILDLESTGKTASVSITDRHRLG